MGKDKGKVCYVCKIPIQDDEKWGFRSYFGYFHPSCIEKKKASSKQIEQRADYYPNIRSNTLLHALVVAIFGFSSVIFVPAMYPELFKGGERDLAMLAILFIIGAIAGLAFCMLAMACIPPKSKTNI